MDIFHGDHGPTAVVDASLAGVRLQAYVARTFRESVGRGVGTMHATSKVSAFEIVRAGRVYVNGALAAGRRVLEAGDVVTVAPAAADGAAAATAVADPPARRLEGRSRMALGGATEPQRREAPEAAAAAEAAACRDAFRAYYLQQRLWSAEEWPAVERAFAQPLPLTEASAMLPALALAPRPGHCGQNLCAAPGGKTLQMLDKLAASGGGEGGDREGGSRGGGGGDSRGGGGGEGGRGGGGGEGGGGEGGGGEGGGGDGGGGDGGGGDGGGGEGGGGEGGGGEGWCGLLVSNDLER
ncbi:hypothetical protein EMIHUDRAFT_123034, partial [Emiliania huxleyi CCMP1516]|uniref:RNA-binding S4 domain-containing protein n=2 Tax=Emiliania huxleyi TaxID=2903 RepID=A0A0D3K7T1_EMIH1